MTYLVVDESVDLGTDRFEVPADIEGIHATYPSLGAAADQLVWLEKAWVRDLNNSGFKIYRLKPQIAEYPIAEARKRAGVVDSAKDASVSHAVYEDLVQQNQLLSEKIEDLEATNRSLSEEPDKWRKAHLGKCIELDGIKSRLDKARKALDAE